MAILEFRNYKEFCRYYGIPIKTGEAKQNQMKYLKTVLDMEKVPHSQKIIVTGQYGVVNIPDIPKEIAEENYLSKHSKKIEERVNKYIDWYTKRRKPYNLDDLKKKAEKEILSKYRKKNKYSKPSTSNKQYSSSLVQMEFNKFKKNATFVPYTCSILNELMQDKSEYYIVTFHLYEMFGFHKKHAYTYENINIVISLFAKEIGNNEIALSLFNYFNRLLSIKKNNILQSTITSLFKRKIYIFNKTFLLISFDKKYFVRTQKDIKKINELKKNNIQKTSGSYYNNISNYNENYHAFFIKDVNEYMGEDFIDINDAYIIKKAENYYEYCDAKRARKTINENMCTSFKKYIYNRYNGILKKSFISSDLEKWIIGNKEKYEKLGNIYIEYIIKFDIE